MTATGAPFAPTHDRGRVARRSADGQVVGALLILGGIIWLLQRSGAVDMSWQTGLSIVLVVLGVGLVVTARSRGGSGLIVLGLVMTAVLASTSSIDIGVLQEGVGDRAFHPTTIAEAEKNDALGIGSLNIDLRALDGVATGTHELKYTIGLGEINIILPEDIAVRVRATMQGGEMQILEQRRSGGRHTATARDEGWDTAETRLDIVVSMGLGNIQVSRAPF